MSLKKVEYRNVRLLHKTGKKYVYLFIYLFFDVIIYSFKTKQRKRHNYSQRWWQAR